MLARALAQPLARIGRSLVWITNNEGLVVKYIPYDATTPSDELLSAHALPWGVTPTYHGYGFELELPTGERGPWLTLWFERFPQTLLEWGKLDEAQTSELFRQVRALHAAGVYHLDIHARNIVLRPVEGRALPDIRLIDFGRARLPIDPVDQLCCESEDWRSFEYSALRRMITVRKK